MGRNFDLSSQAIASLPAGIELTTNEVGQKVVTTPGLSGSTEVVGRGDPGGPQNDFGGGRTGVDSPDAPNQAS